MRTWIKLFGGCNILTLILYTCSESDPENFDPAHLPASVINAVEADSFWCLSRLLDGIQDNYINQQPGIHRSVKRMQDLVGRIDGAFILLLTGDELHPPDYRLTSPSAPLAAHLDREGVEFMQFAFRWMNCLLMREISVKNTIRMWDTYLVRQHESYQFERNSQLDFRRRVRRHSLSSIFMSARLSS